MLVLAEPWSHLDKYRSFRAHDHPIECKAYQLRDSRDHNKYHGLHIIIVQKKGCNTKVSDVHEVLEPMTATFLPR
jgi:hypothetical protein